MAAAGVQVERKRGAVAALEVGDWCARYKLSGSRGERSLDASLERRPHACLHLIPRAYKHVAFGRTPAAAFAFWYIRLSLAKAGVSLPCAAHCRTPSSRVLCQERNGLVNA
eukprot:5085906-Pleurochrysis_carterae.AAC.1